MANDFLQRVADASYQHCHVMHLHSFLLQESPVVRMFFAMPQHELWKNTPHHPWSLAFHTHRTDITLEPLMGEVTNVLAGYYAPGTRQALGGIPAKGFRWDSKIRGGVGGFVPKNTSGVLNLFKGEKLEWPTSLSGAQLHTIHVPQGQIAAWLVHEHSQVSGFSSVAYSNMDLLEFSSDGMYLPVTRNLVQACFRQLPAHVSDTLMLRYAASPQPESETTP